MVKSSRTELGKHSILWASTNHSGNCLSYGDECATGVESVTFEGDGYSLFSGTVASSQENGPNIALAFSDSNTKHERGQTRWIINTNPVKIYTKVASLLLAAWLFRLLPSAAQTWIESSAAVSTGSLL